MIGHETVPERTHCNTVGLGRVRKLIVLVERPFCESHGSADREVVLLSLPVFGCQTLVDQVHSRDDSSEIGCATREELSRIFEDLRVDRGRRGE